MINIPRILIAGTNSGCGKTTVTAGVLAALVKKGHSVQPYKVGPDYVDPMFHSFVTGRYSRNLDSWMLDEKVVTHLLLKNVSGADIAFVEGVMGLYDGYGGYSTTGSSAHVSGIIKAPIILVVNGEGASLSISAIIRGFIDFDNDVDIKGVIINNIKSESHYLMLKETIEEHTGVMVVGYLLKSAQYSLTSRHLGLVPQGEIGNLKEKVDMLGEEVLKTIDLELIMKIAKDSQSIDNSFHDTAWSNERCSLRPKIAVANDKAFNFYYKDSLELLEDMGAQLLYFSPLEDIRLPEDISGLYLGGGYPEVFSKDLEENRAMRKSVREAVCGGLPTYAECGGLMYLTESITDMEGKAFSMAGVIPGKSRMTSRLQRFGYVELEIEAGSVLSSEGQKVRAHEFHYSQTVAEDVMSLAYNVSKHRRGKEVMTWKCGYKMHNLLAGYPHIHLWANPKLAKGFVDSCTCYSKEKKYEE